MQILGDTGQSMLKRFGKAGERVTDVYSPVIKPVAGGVFQYGKKVAGIPGKFIESITRPFEAEEEAAAPEPEAEKPKKKKPSKPLATIPPISEEARRATTDVRPPKVEPK